MLGDLEDSLCPDVAGGRKSTASPLPRQVLFPSWHALHDSDPGQGRQPESDVRVKLDHTHPLIFGTIFNVNRVVTEGTNRNS